MQLATTLHFESPLSLLIAGSLVLIAIVIARVRRPAVPAITSWLVGAGLLLLSLAAGLPSVDRPRSGEVTVMVDRSASTRTARFRDPSYLRARISALLGATPWRLVSFSQTLSSSNELAGSALADLPGDETNFSAPANGPIVLFSDAQFTIPRNLNGAVYVVVDPGIESASDAAITRIEFRANDAVVGVANSGGPRNVSISGVGGDAAALAPTAHVVISRPLNASARRVSATISKADPWPENDSLSAIVPPSPNGGRWWIGDASPDASWRRIDPRDFPTDAAALLSPSIIVLNNVAATDLSPEQQDRLRQYARDFGGGLLILGGDRAFAAGGYAGSTLEAISPLASTPPEPTSHWLILADSSGSMGTDAGAGATRWTTAVDAIAKLIPALPPADRVSIGGFARELNWWVRDAAAKDVSPNRFPPAGVSPRGPTMLEEALRKVAGSTGDSVLPSQLLLMTDGGATLDNPAAIASSLKSKKVRLNVLIIGEEAGAGIAALRQIADSTQGRVMTELDPQKWTRAVRELMRAATPNLLRQDPLTINFLDRLKTLPPARVELWNRTWLKSSAFPLAEASGGAERFTPVARATGDARIIAAAFTPSVAQIEALTKQVERPPHDPRFTATWEIGAKARVTVDAVAEDGRYLNHEQVSISMTSERGEAAMKPSPLAQIGPGKYQLTFDAPREPAIAELHFARGSTEFRSIAGRYPAEFEAIGNNRPTMTELADRTGGRVIEPGDSRPIDFKWPTRQAPLGSMLAMMGVALIATGLVRWRVA